ncbi:histone-lysine N-methyltransferase SETMAR-like [Tachypleus tridentatus]|uniref:histone-lysine N-methyltransferase SETMAR-like n=1 Tax=Tachypleus tridentatus TaxID=6853 RepID=UPI003FD5121F
MKYSVSLLNIFEVKTGGCEMEYDVNMVEAKFKLGHDNAIADRNVKHAFSHDTANERTAQRWFKRFRFGDTSFESEPRGRPQSAINEEELEALVESDIRQTVRELADELTENHQTRVEICSSLLTSNKNDLFIHRIVSFEEKGFFYDNRRKFRQRLDYDESPKHMPKTSSSP